MSKRRQIKEEGLGDPLSDLQTFNILQFVGCDGDTPIDSPLVDSLGLGNANPNFIPNANQLEPTLDMRNPPVMPQQHLAAPQQQSMRHPGQGQMHHAPNHPGMVQQQGAGPQSAPQQGQNGMFQIQTNRLPDSPPITDISGNGSSASPSSNSDPPYSPDNYGNYAGIINNNGLILGVQGLEGTAVGQGMQPSEMLAAQANQPRMGAQQMSSPQSVCFLSPYAPSSQQPTPNSLAQVSPPPATQELYQYNQSNMDLYSILHGSNEGSLNSQNSEAPQHRKRPRLDTNMMPGMVGNPMASSPIDSTYADENYSHQVIRFQKFQEEMWNPLYDANEQPLHQLQVHVVADKGFNYSTVDGCFVNQKKNHFQVSVHIEACDNMPPKYVRYQGQLHLVNEFKLAFCGVKAEMTTSEIQIKQSKTDRKPIPHDPVVFEIHERRMTKVTVPRLHFSETTLNNQRKNYKPNPDQKYFNLVVRLLASINNEVVLVQAYASEKVIVRATNPGSFEPPDSDITWFRSGNTLYSNGPVSIGTDKNIAKLTVDGDIYTPGRLIHPSDIRLKEDITEKEAHEALENLKKLRIVDYMYKPEIAEKWGLTEDQRKKTGLIAQELAAVIPEAVRDIGEYLTVDESRVFYETVLATQELVKMHDDLDSKIDDKVEAIHQRLARFARRKKLLGSMASSLNEGGAFDNKSMLSYSHASLASTIPSKEKKDRRRRHHEDVSTPLCSSKWTQGTIVVLVAVMALCLIAMSGLYVLDWHNRNYAYNQAHSNENKPEIAGNMIVRDHHLLPLFHDAPPLLASCGQYCHQFCCSDHMRASAEQIAHIQQPGPQANNMITESERVARSTSFNRPTAYSSLPTGVSISLPTFNVSLDSRYCIKNSCSKRHGVYSLFVPVSPYLPNIPVEVQFVIPKGKILNNCGYLADFDNSQCDSGEDPFHMEKARNPLSTQITDEVFELSVGSYSQSAYRFRVSYTTESCFSSEDHQHGTYEEYNLIFYRNCSLTYDPEAIAAASKLTAIAPQTVKLTQLAPAI